MRRLRDKDGIAVLPGSAITGLMEATGWTHGELAARMVTSTRRLAPSPTEDLVRAWEARDGLGLPLSLCLRDTAAGERLVWKRGRWVRTSSERMSGEEVRSLREQLGWTQGRLARELDTTQQSVAQWEASPEKRVSGLATYALRSVRARYFGPTPAP